MKKTPDALKVEEEEDGMMVTGDEEKGMVLSPAKRDPSSTMLASAFSTPCSSASTSGQSVSLPKGTLIKQLLKQEAQSPALARKHLQQLQEQTLIRQKSSSTTTHAFDERLASVSAFPTSGAVAARASTPSENPTLTPASLRDGGHSDSTSNTRNEGAFRGDAFPSSDRPNTSPTASHSSTEESFIGGPPTSGKEKFQCPHCSEIVTGRKNLQDHLAKVHAQPDKFTCPTCGRIFKYMTSLAHHIQTVCHDLNAANETPTPTMTPATMTTPKTTTTSGVAGSKRPWSNEENPDSPPPALHPPAPPMTPPPSASSSEAQTSPLTPSRKSRRISKRNSGGGPGLENGESEAEVEETEKKSMRRLLQMGGAETGELAGGYVILNEET